MTEPDVTLSDYGLAILCTGFSWSLRKYRIASKRIAWQLFFGSVAAASLVGGTVHGFFLDEASTGYQLLWPTTLLAIGITAASAWALAGIRASVAAALFLIYAAVVIFYSQNFLVVILNYLPAMIALLICSIRSYLKARSRYHLKILSGILVSFVAAYLQQAQIAFHPDYFNYNSTYHLVQAVGLCILYSGAKGQLVSERVTS